MVISIYLILGRYGKLLCQVNTEFLILCTHIVHKINAPHKYGVHFLAAQVLSLLENMFNLAFVTQQPFGITNGNFDTCIFVARVISTFHHTVVNVAVLAVLPQ